MTKITIHTLTQEYDGIFTTAVYTSMADLDAAAREAIQIDLDDAGLASTDDWQEDYERLLDAEAVRNWVHVDVHAVDLPTPTEQDLVDALIPEHGGHDPEGMNDARTEWADDAVHTFMGMTGVDPEDAVGDLLANMMHLCHSDPDRWGDFKNNLLRACEHFRYETVEGC